MASKSSGVPEEPLLCSRTLLNSDVKCFNFLLSSNQPIFSRRDALVVLTLTSFVLDRLHGSAEVASDVFR